MKILKSKKALSPVVASIILIAVTVAVSLAVAIWMGSLTTGQMQTESLHIIQVVFPDTSKVKVILRNTGSSPITVNEIYIAGGGNSTTNLLGTPVPIPANDQKEVELLYSWNQGFTYQIRVVTAKGNQYFYTVTAPTS
jgi:flagellin-like protein